MAEGGCSSITLGEVFDRAASHVRKRVGELDGDRLLELYAYYKQAKEGPCNVPRPRWYEMQAKQKWEAWYGLGSMDQETAMKRYISVVSALDPGWEAHCSAAAEDKENSQQNVGWAAVSCLPDTDDYIADTDKTIFDWVKEGNVEKVLELGQQTTATHTVDDRDEAGLGLIHWAADRGCLPVARCLLERLCADVNLRDEDGQTALHYAASCGHVEMVQLLLERGADRSLADGDGSLPLDVAADSAVASLLEA